jgi:hypothetical protein
MKLLATIVMVLLLSACGPKALLQVKEKRIVVMPPEGLWYCPDIPEPPAGEYTQAEVADYVLRMYETHKVCDAALDNVRAYLEEAKLVTEKIEE